MARSRTSTASITASYRTLCTIARGGMGEVELAVRREGQFERLFAIKRLKPEFLHEADVRAMFLDEARIAGLLRHPNVVSVVDVGEDHRGPFLVMEYVDGISAANLIEDASEARVPMEIALRVARDVAEGLHSAHELVDADGRCLHLVHRDVSPQNILIGFDGIARVTDFGIAKALGRTSKTSTGVLKGKLGYMAPEQLRFEELDRRADLFALGIVLFELLTGRRLYRSVKEMDGPRRILTEPPPDLADYRDDVEPALAELSFELLAKDREARPETARVVARRLEGILAQSIGTDATESTEFLAERFAPMRARRQAQVTEALAGPMSDADLSGDAGAHATQAPPRASPLRHGRWVVLGSASLVVAASLSIAAALRAKPSTEAAPASNTAAGDGWRDSARDAIDADPGRASTALGIAPDPPRPLETAVPAAVSPSSAAPAKRAAPKPAASRRPGTRNGVPIWESY